VVVAVGLTFVEPLAEAELNPAGEIEIVAAPLVAQLSELLEPAFMLVGFAVKDVIEGVVPVPAVFGELVAPPQLVRQTPASRMRISAQRSGPEERCRREPTLLLIKGLRECKRNPVIAIAHTRLVITPLSWLLVARTELGWVHEW
jgi:hypothetical protein